MKTMNMTGLSVRAKLFVYKYQTVLVTAFFLALLIFSSPTLHAAGDFKTSIDTLSSKITEKAFMVVGAILKSACAIALVSIAWINLKALLLGSKALQAAREETVNYIIRTALILALPLVMKAVAEFGSSLGKVSQTDLQTTGTLS